MKTIFLQILVITLFCKMSKSQVTIKITMPANSITRMRYANDQNEVIPLTFRNDEKHLQIIEQNLLLTKPTIFRYSLDNEYTSKKYRHTFLLYPKDSLNIAFDKSGDIYITDSLQGKKFIEQLVVLDFDKITNNVEKDWVWARNEKILDSLALTGDITNTDCKIIKLLVAIKYYTNITTPIYEEGLVTKDLDEKFLEIKNKFDTFKSISCIDIMDLYDRIINYKLTNKKSKTLLDFIKEANLNDQGNIAKAYIKRLLNFFPEKSSEEYKSAIKYLSNYDSAYNENIQILDDILKFNLISENKAVSNLLNELNTLPKNGLIVLDFWASWCAPCIGEFPFLKNQKEKLSTLPIKFIPINMDTDKNDKAWLGVSAKYHYLFKTINYRVPDKYKKQISDFFIINSIPRYVVLNKQGKIIDTNFNRPSEKEFEINLRSYFNKAF